MPRLLPIFLDLEDKPVLLIGGGSVAREKLIKLIPTGALIKVVASEIHPETKRLIEAHGLPYEERPFAVEDAVDSRLIISAVNDPEASRAIAAMARACSVLINAVDLPLDSDFYFAAQIERGPLQIAISTRGVFPGVARAIRLWLEEFFPTEIATQLEDLGKLRLAIRSNIPNTLERMFALRQQLEIWQFGLSKPRSVSVSPIATNQEI